VDVVRLSRQYKIELKSLLIKQVASLKSALVKRESVKNTILSSLLDVCRVYLQPKLLKYLLWRFIPYMHSLQSSYFDSTLFYLLGELLNYVVAQINDCGNFQL
jgi:phosphatidylinositol 4-kinase